MAAPDQVRSSAYQHVSGTDRIFGCFRQIALVDGLGERVQYELPVDPGLVAAEQGQRSVRCASPTPRHGWRRELLLPYLCRSAAA